MSSASPLKSKKKLFQSAIATPKSKSNLSNSDPIAAPTPDKPPSQLRLRNRHVALSVKEIRKAAAPGNETFNSVKSSVRRQISTWPDESTSAKEPTKSNKSPPEARIPAKYEILIEFFDSLHSSIRLLKLKGAKPTFTNISPKIECLTDRRFSHGHLAQLKYILPEVIEIKRVLTFDERTSCMKPDLHVSINVDAIECESNSKSESRNLDLRKVFRARLAGFVKAHPEGDEIPEELLPEPFNRSKLDLSSVEIKVGTQSSGVESPTDAHINENQRPTVASHLSQSFTRRFSLKVTNSDKVKTSQDSPNASSQQSAFPVPEPFLDKVSSNEETNVSAPTVGYKCPDDVLTTSKQIDSAENGCSAKLASLQSTPSKFILTPSKLMSATPELHSQKRCYMSPDDDSTSLADKLVRRPVRTRSLKFESHLQNLENEVNDTGNVSADDDDILKILPESLLQSIREKERKAQEERDPAISQAKRRQQMIACLPKLFNLMHFLFQSIKRSVITKAELIHKIIVGHSDIVDRKEVEEQLNLLLELVPEWISTKLTSTGDSLFCINKMSSPETIRARLEEAK